MCLFVYVAAASCEGGCSFVVKRKWRFKFAEVRQRFRLTPTEKRVAVFVLAAVVLGLATKCYRDAHFSSAPATWKIEQTASVRTTKVKGVSQKPTRQLSDRGFTNHRSTLRRDIMLH